MKTSRKVGLAMQDAYMADNQSDAKEQGLPF